MLVQASCNHCNASLRVTAYRASARSHCSHVAMQQLLAAELLDPLLDIAFFVYQARQKNNESDAQRQLK